MYLYFGKNINFLKSSTFKRNIRAWLITSNIACAYNNNCRAQIIDFINFKFINQLINDMQYDYEVRYNLL